MGIVSYLIHSGTCLGCACVVLFCFVFFEGGGGGMVVRFFLLTSIKVSGIAAMPKGPGDSDVSRPRFSGALDRVSCLNS